MGTIRIVPMGYGLTLTETLLKQLGRIQPLVSNGSWEVGRLVLTPDCRSDVDTLRRCLFLALSFAYEHASVKNLYASCTHVLSRLYRRFGFSAFAKDVPLQGTDKTYTLIQGAGHRVLDALAGRKAAS